MFPASTCLLIRFAGAACLIAVIFLIWPAIDGGGGMRQRMLRDAAFCLSLVGTAALLAGTFC